MCGWLGAGGICSRRFAPQPGVSTPGSEGLSDQRARFYLTNTVLPQRSPGDRVAIGGLPPLLGAGFSGRPCFPHSVCAGPAAPRSPAGSSESRALLGVSLLGAICPAPRSQESGGLALTLSDQFRAHLTLAACRRSAAGSRGELRCVDQMPSRSWSYCASTPYPAWSPGSRCTCPPTVASRARHASVCCAMILASLFGLTLAVYLIGIAETFIAAFALVYSSPKRSDVSPDPPDQRPISTCRMKGSPRAAADAIMQCRQLCFV